MAAAKRVWRLFVFFSLLAVVTPDQSQPIAITSTPLRKQHHHHHHRSKQGGRGTGRRLLENEPLEGSVGDGYFSFINIGGQTFQMVMDTGSSYTAVLTYPFCNLPYYSKDCPGPTVGLVYGSGNWTGRSCKDDVSLGTLEAGAIVFDGMFEQSGMLVCSEGPDAHSGIVGLGYAKGIDPPENVYTFPLWDQIVETTGISDVFSMQCCGTSNLQDSFDDQGHFDVGGVVAEHFKGEMVYTPVTQELYYGVDLTDLKIGGRSVLPPYSPSERSPSVASRLDSKLPPRPRTVVDSGTSYLVLTPDLFMVVKKTLQELVPEAMFFPEGFWTATVCLPRERFTLRPEEWPTIKIQLRQEGGTSLLDTFELSIPACRYLLQSTTSCPVPGTSGYMLAIEGAEGDNVLGQTLMQSYYTVFDRENGRVGFASIAGCGESDCAGDPPDSSATLKVDNGLAASLRQASPTTFVVPLVNLLLFLLHVSALVLFMASFALMAVAVRRCRKRAGYQAIDGH